MTGCSILRTLHGLRLTGRAAFMHTYGGVAQTLNPMWLKAFALNLGFYRPSLLRSRVLGGSYLPSITVLVTYKPLKCPDMGIVG